MRAVRILGVDPGTVVVGFGCLEVRARAAARPDPGQPLALRAANVRHAQGTGQTMLLESGQIRLGGSRVAIEVRLHRLSVELAALIERLQPDELALEEAFCGRNAQSALRIGEARGVVLAEAARGGVAVFQFPPARIKRSVAGHGTATKDRVARMAGEQLGLSLGHLPRDATDALAVALCRLEERRAQILGGR